MCKNDSQGMCFDFMLSQFEALNNYVSKFHFETVLISVRWGVCCTTTAPTRTSSCPAKKSPPSTWRSASIRSRSPSTPSASSSKTAATQTSGKCPNWNHWILCTSVWLGRSDEGLTPVHIASAWGRCAILELLLGCGGDADLQDINGNTPMDYAIEQQHKQAVCMLEEHQKGSSVNTFFDAEEDHYDFTLGECQRPFQHVCWLVCCKCKVQFKAFSKDLGWNFFLLINCLVFI